MLLKGAIVMSQEVTYMMNMKRNMNCVSGQMNILAGLADLSPDEKEEWKELQEKVAKMNSIIDQKLKVKLNLLDEVYKDFCNAPTKLRSAIMNDLLPLKIFTRDEFNDVFKNDASMMLFAMMIEHGVKDEILDMRQKWFAYDVENVELSSAAAPEYFLKGWKEFTTTLIRNKEALMKLGYSEEQCQRMQKEYMK